MTLPLHETHTVEEDAVENKKAHVGILKSSFLKGEESVRGYNNDQIMSKKKKGKQVLWCSHLVYTQSPKGQGFTCLCVN